MAAVAVDGVIHALGGATDTTAENRHTVAVHYIYGHPYVVAMES